MDTPYNIIYQVGDIVIIELKTLDIFEGEFCDGGKNRIDLINVKQHNNLNQLGGVYSFYRNEIINIYRPKHREIDKQEKSDINPVVCSNIQICEEEYSRLKEVCKNYIYLNQMNNEYFESLETLSEAETIGVLSVGTDERTTDTIKLLALCTWKQVYLFDFVNFANKEMCSKLKDILESEYVAKVIHGGSSLVHILHQLYGINIHNSFDTQIVDLILAKTNTGTCPKAMANISQCLLKHLNFPPSFLRDALSISTQSWNERPITEEMKFYASQLVVYLLPLKEHIMKKIILCNIYKSFDNVHNFYCNLDNYTFSHIVQNNKITKEMDDLIPMLTTLNLKHKREKDKFTS